VGDVRTQIENKPCFLGDGKQRHLSHLFTKEERRSKFCSSPVPPSAGTSLLAKLGLCLRRRVTAEGNESDYSRYSVNTIIGSVISINTLPLMSSDLVPTCDIFIYLCVCVGCVYVC